MTTKTENQSRKSNLRNFTEFCSCSCRQLLAQLDRTKAAVLNEFQQAFASDEHILKLAVNEAEALAWQSGYPQLVFADLAAEKAQALVLWNQRQKTLARA
jgi:hypothetical protein